MKKSTNYDSEFFMYTMLVISFQCNAGKALNWFEIIKIHAPTVTLVGMMTNVL